MVSPGRPAHRGAHVRQRLLRGPVHGQPRLGAQLARLAAELDRDRQPAVLLERSRGRVDPLRPGQLLAALGRDRSAGLVQAAGRGVVGAVDCLRHVLVSATGNDRPSRSLRLLRALRRGLPSR